MIGDILTDVGIPYRHTRFQTPPEETYAVYTQDMSAEGADSMQGGVYWVTNEITVNLYEPYLDDDTELKMENTIASYGCEWRKRDRQWLQDEQRYQVTYTFEYVEKRRINNG